MKLSHLSNPMLQQALSELAEMPLPMRQAYDVSRLVDTARSEFQRYDKLRMDLLHRFGDKDEHEQLITSEQGNVQLSPENLLAFQGALDELQAVEIELPAVLPMAAFENVKLSPVNVGLLVSAGILVP